MLYIYVYYIMISIKKTKNLKNHVNIKIIKKVYLQKYSFYSVILPFQIVQGKKIQIYLGLN